MHTNFKNNQDTKNMSGIRNIDTKRISSLQTRTEAHAKRGLPCGTGHSETAKKNTLPQPASHSCLIQ